MSSEPDESTKNSQLINVLREGVGVVQMILFKEVRTSLAANHPDRDSSFHSMLAGAVVGEVFGSVNPDEKFRRFRDDNLGLIEQELLGLAEAQSLLLPSLTDALRIQTLCDNQEGTDSGRVLTRADELGLLLADRDIPLPSTFMTTIRTLGQQHNLIIPPVPITPEEDSQMIH